MLTGIMAKIWLPHQFDCEIYREKENGFVMEQTKKFLKFFSVSTKIWIVL